VKTDRRRLLLGAVGSGVSACTPFAGEGRTSSRIRWLAKREGALRILTNTSLMGPVLDAFCRRWPDIKVGLDDMNSTRIAEAVRRAADAAEAGPDLVWSTAMDVQVKLINDGYAQVYRSPYRHSMPNGSVWRDQGYGLTAEPIVFAYNRRMLTPDVIPRSHGGLLELLSARPEAFDGRIGLYDAEHSGVALMQLSADVQIYPDAWRLVDAMGARRPWLDTSGQRMLRRIADGRMAFGYNINRSYGAYWAAKAPTIGLVTPEDYHLSVSRVAFIPRNAAHPNAGRLFLDFLLSREGQGVIAALGIRPVRNDVDDADRPLEAGARPLRVGPALLANLDQVRRAKLLRRWNDAMKLSTRAPADPAAP
jgi:iron(III) transport system substrate-binding protein